MMALSLIYRHLATSFVLLLTTTSTLLAQPGSIDDPGNESASPQPAAQAVGTNSSSADNLAASLAGPSSSSQKWESCLDLARHYREIGEPRNAEPILIGLLTDPTPEPVQQQALLELALDARNQNDLPRAQQVYAQFLSRWSGAIQVPEILLRQGQLFRQMGLNNLALAKFYGVMTSALVLKNDKLEYYKRLVFEAQSEIADTHYRLGRYDEAAECFSRLLKQNNAALDRATVLSRMVRTLSALGRDEETVSHAQDLLSHFPHASSKAEVRFCLALALKHQNRNQEALQQVLLLLREGKSLTAEQPDLWTYWQQRAGNVIGNQLYREGDYVRALEVYSGLASLDLRPAWQLPVKYQIGLSYERLQQPGKALECYHEILKQQATMEKNASPTLKTILEMAQWRADFVAWQSKAEARGIRPGD